MQHSPSWEANSSSASQEIRGILWNPKIYYRIRKCQPPVPVLRQINPVHILSTFLNIHFNIILPSTVRSFRIFPSLGSPHQTLYAPPPPKRATYSVYLMRLNLLVPEFDI
jgi:hypothetical protein